MLWGLKFFCATLYCSNIVGFRPHLRVLVTLLELFTHDHIYGEQKGRQAATLASASGHYNRL